MKKVIIVLSFLCSFVAMAESLPKQCSDTSKPTIENKEVHGNKVAIVHVFGKTAKDLYTQVSGDEVSITENKKDYIIKSQGEIHCFRHEKAKSNPACSVYECEVGAIQ